MFIGSGLIRKPLEVFQPYFVFQNGLERCSGFDESSDSGIQQMAFVFFVSRIHIASWRERYLYSWRRSYCSPDALRERNLLRLGEPWIGFWLYFSISGHLGAKVLGKLVDSCSYAWFSSCWPWVQGFHLCMLGPPSLEFPAWRTTESNLPSMVESTWGMKAPLHGSRGSKGT